MKKDSMIIALAVLAVVLGFTACESTEEPEVKPVSMPSAEPDSRKVPVGSTVTLSDATPDAVIYYTTDGSDPDTGSARYADPIRITENHIVLKAIAVLDGESSGVMHAFYTSDAEIIDEMVESPIPSPLPGAVPAGTLINLTSGTPGAVIYYTHDGSDPMLSNTRSNAATSPPVIIVQTTLKAYAQKNGMHNSGILTGYYTVSTDQREAEPYPLPGKDMDNNILGGYFKGGYSADHPVISAEIQAFLDSCAPWYDGGSLPSGVISMAQQASKSPDTYLQDNVVLFYDYETVLNEYTDWVEPNGQFTLSINDVEQTAIQNSITLGLEASLGLKVEGFSASLTASIKDTSSTTFTTIRGKTVTQSWDLTKFDQAYKYKVVLVGRLKVISHDTKVDQSHISGLGGVIDTTWVDQTSLTWRLVHN